MNTTHVSSSGGMTASQSSATPIRFSGRWLVFARVVWVSLVLVLLALFVILLPPYFALLQTICTTSSCALVQPTPQSLQALQQIGLSIEDYAIISLALVIAAMVVCLVVGVVIFLRKSDEWMALLASFFMIPFGILYMTDVFQEISSSWRLLAILLNIFCNGVFFLMGTLFPSGHYVPRWSRWLAAVWVLWGLVFAVLRDLPSLYMVHRLVWLVLVLCVIAAQLYRYRSVSSFSERQQTKWVVFAGSITALILVGLTIPGVVVPAFRQPGSLYQVITGPFFPVGVLLTALSVGIAILLYRLWDIDIIINRTLVYGTLTAILAAIYAALVISLQAFLRGILSISQDNSISLVVSTLVIAALFQPLRRRVQRVIDRRFYRSKYDATKIIQAFTVTLRNEMDLNTLSEQLEEVVQETMHPSHVSLWLSRPPRTGRQPSSNEPPSVRRYSSTD